MRHSTKPARHFETLENRTLMAGNVTAAVVSGNLTVTGDAKSNLIYVTQNSDGGWRILGVNTKVNGKKSLNTAPVTGNISIDLGQGNNWLNMHSGIVPGQLDVVTGNGNDNASLWDMVVGTEVSFQGNGGNDTLFIENVEVTDSSFSAISSIDMGNGKDHVTIKHFTDQNLQVALGAGNDHLNIDKSQLLGGPSPQLIIDAGDGKDTVSVSNFETGDISVEMGLGDKDGLQFSSVTADNADLLDTGGIKGLLRGVKDQITHQTIAAAFTNRSGDLRVDK